MKPYGSPLFENRDGLDLAALLRLREVELRAAAARAFARHRGARVPPEALAALVQAHEIRPLIVNEAESSMRVDQPASRPSRLTIRKIIQASGDPALWHVRPSPDGEPVEGRVGHGHLAVGAEVAFGQEPEAHQHIEMVIAAITAQVAAMGPIVVAFNAHLAKVTASIAREVAALPIAGRAPAITKATR